VAMGNARFGAREPQWGGGHAAAARESRQPKTVLNHTIYFVILSIKNHFFLSFFIPTNNNLMIIFYNL